MNLFLLVDRAVWYQSRLGLSNQINKCCLPLDLLQLLNHPLIIIIIMNHSTTSIHHLHSISNHSTLTSGEHQSLSFYSIFSLPTLHVSSPLSLSFCWTLDSDSLLLSTPPLSSSSSSAASSRPPSPPPAQAHRRIKSLDLDSYFSDLDGPSCPTRPSTRLRPTQHSKRASIAFGRPVSFTFLYVFKLGFSSFELQKWTLSFVTSGSVNLWDRRRKSKDVINPSEEMIQSQSWWRVRAMMMMMMMKLIKNGFELNGPLSSNVNALEKNTFEDWSSVVTCFNLL